MMRQAVRPYSAKSPMKKVIKIQCTREICAVVMESG